MNAFYMVIYFTAFALLMGSAFAFMYANLKSITDQMNNPVKKHPEAPEPGEEVLYVDVSTNTTEEFREIKEGLEDLFKK